MCLVGQTWNPNILSITINVTAYWRCWSFMFISKIQRLDMLFPEIRLLFKSVDDVHVTNRTEISWQLSLSLRWRRTIHLIQECAGDMKLCWNVFPRQSENGINFIVKSQPTHTWMTSYPEEWPSSEVPEQQSSLSVTIHVTVKGVMWRKWKIWTYEFHRIW